ncbi:ZNHIT1 [Blepharisma stoltei]|uniref:HIT-type domain-containing protein n=1 Tax=Blepharisma stoltei TaxID=1481888 RepID=A0AAU9J786_9CILI|nr:unnamed protein product [Blepharisma stoltei]
MKYVDEETRALVHQQRINDLEEDNFLAANRLEEMTFGDDSAFTFEDELLPRKIKKTQKCVKENEILEENESPLYSKKKRKTKKSPLIKKRVHQRKSLERIILEEGLSINDAVPNYLTMSVKASDYPRRFFCTVCGFQHKYTCIRCGERYCSKKCESVHKETRCLKFSD